jgi:hypothetical protein
VVSAGTHGFLLWERKNVGTDPLIHTGWIL